TGQWDVDDGWKAHQGHRYDQGQSLDRAQAAAEGDADAVEEVAGQTAGTRLAHTEPLGEDEDHIEGLHARHAEAEGDRQPSPAEAGPPRRVGFGGGGQLFGPGPRLRTAGVLREEVVGAHRHARRAARFAAVEVVHTESLPSTGVL